MGGPRLTPKTERLLLSIWMTLRKDGKDPTALQVLAAAAAHAKTHDSNSIFLPKIRKVQNMIKDAKKHYEALSPDEKILQKPWSMASLVQHELPPESIPSILEVWRYSLALDQKFTIRQAKWVSRLHASTKDTTLLWINSGLYSDEEYLSLLSGKPINTQNIDVYLVLSDSEFNTILTTGIYDNLLEWNEGIYISPPYSSDGGIAEELLHAIPYRSILLGNIEADKATRLYEAGRMLLNLPSTSNFFPHTETRLVYLRYLSYISNGPEWSNLPSNLIFNIIVQLRQWVLDNESKLSNGPKHLYELVGY